MSDGLDADDRVKLATWYHRTTLLDDYHLLALDPMYQRGLKPFASAQDREIRETKLKAILSSRTGWWPGGRRNLVPSGGMRFSSKTRCENAAQPRKGSGAYSERCVSVTTNGP
jgi:hypothetical protein